jgi:hypothetical protein
MGLLDEAIRDHLELKRRGGADPTEIARAERSALAPVFPDEPRPEGDEAEPVADEAAPADVVPDAEGHDEVITPLGEETAEIDMEAVMAAGDQALSPPPAAAEADGAGFEWEDPAALAHDAEAEGPPEQIPGQERMSLE